LKIEAGKDVYPDSFGCSIFALESTGNYLYPECTSSSSSSGSINNYTQLLNDGDYILHSGKYRNSIDNGSSWSNFTDVIMDNKSSHFHTKTYLGEGRYKHRSFGDVDLVIPTTNQKTISYSNCDHYFNMEEDEYNRGNLKFRDKDNGTCDLLGDFSMNNMHVVTAVSDNNSYKEIMQLIEGDNISEFEWIFERYPFVINVINDNTTESGGTALFNLKLDSEPTSSVSIIITSDNVSEGLVSSSILIFQPTNWNTEQTITVTGVDDSLIDDNVTFNVVIGPSHSADQNFDKNYKNYLLFKKNNNDERSDYNVTIQGCENNTWTTNSGNTVCEDDIFTDDINGENIQNGKYSTLRLIKGDNNLEFYISKASYDQNNKSYSDLLDLYFGGENTCFGANVTPIPEDFFQKFLLRLIPICPNSSYFWANYLFKEIEQNFIHYIKLDGFSEYGYWFNTSSSPHFVYVRAKGETNALENWKEELKLIEFNQN